MKLYKRKPTEVLAYQITRELLEGILFDGWEYPLGLRGASSSYHKENRTITRWEGTVVTIHGQETRCVEGDYIVQEPDGIHYYPVKKDIFEETYTAL